MSSFLEKSKNELCNIKSKYLNLLEQERQLKVDYENSLLEKLQIDTKRNNKYYGLLEIQRELYRNNNSINNDKTKFIEKKHNKRLFLLGMSFYLIPSCFGFVLSSFISFPSIIVPLISMFSCLITVGLDCIINHKKCFEKYSKEFEEFDSSKSIRSEIERLKTEESKLQTELNLYTTKQNEINKTVDDLERKLNIIKETINLFRINSFEKIIGCQSEKQEIELKLNK